MSAVDRYSPNSLGRMLGKVNSTVFKDEIGEVEYYGNRVLIIRKDVFRRLEEEMQKRHAVGTGRIILTILGRSEGHEEGKTLMRDVMLDTADRRSIPIFVKNALEKQPWIRQVETRRLGRISQDCHGLYSQQCRGRGYRKVTGQRMLLPTRLSRRAVRGTLELVANRVRDQVQRQRRRWLHVPNQRGPASLQDQNLARISELAPLRCTDNADNVPIVEYMTLTQTHSIPSVDTVQ